MKLPNLDQAVVLEEKITAYLLNSAHRKGQDKAAFFTRFGFSMAQWEVMAEALLAHARLYEVASQRETPHGTNYAVEGALSSPDGRNPSVRVIWFIPDGSDTPNFVTAYPLAD